MTVNTIEEAESLQILCAKKTYGYANFQITMDQETGEMHSNEPEKDHRYKILSKSGFIEGDITSIDIAGEWLDDMYLQYIRKENI